MCKSGSGGSGTGTSSGTSAGTASTAAVASVSVDTISGSPTTAPPTNSTSMSDMKDV